MNLKRKEAGCYVTDDGRYEVSKGHVFTECDAPHPVRISRQDRDDIRRAHQSGASREWLDARQRHPWAALDAVRAGKRGYFCEGGEEHVRDSWGVWDLAKDDYVPGGEDFDNMKDAVAFLEGEINA